MGIEKMAIQWRFWKKSGKTFFRKRMTFIINSESLEHVVLKRIYYHGDEEWSKSKIINLIDNEISEFGHPAFWSLDYEQGSVSSIEFEFMRKSARSIVESHFPAAYIIKNT